MTDLGDGGVSASRSVKSIQLSSNSGASVCNTARMKGYNMRMSHIRPMLRREAAVLFSVVETVVDEFNKNNPNKAPKVSKAGDDNNRKANDVNRDQPGAYQPNSSVVSLESTSSIGRSQSQSAILETFDFFVSPVEDIPMLYMAADGSVQSLAPRAGEFIYPNLLYSEQNDKYKLPIQNTDIMVVEESDSIQMKALTSMFGSGLLRLNQLESAMLTFQRNACVRSFVNKTILPSDGLPIEPTLPDTVRSVQESEILTFSSLSSRDFHRYRQIQDLEQLVKAHSKPLPNFTGLTKKQDGEDGSILKRRYFRPLMSQTLAQILTNESLREPIVLKKYYQPSDELLYVLFWPTPERRQSAKVFIPAEHIRQKDKFIKPLPSKGKRKVANDVVESKVELSELAMGVKEWERLIHDRVTLTPAGQGLVTVTQFRSSQLSWVSTHVSGYILGLRGHLANPNVGGAKISSRVPSARSSRSQLGTSNPDGTDGVAELSGEAVVEGEGGGEAVNLEENTDNGVDESAGDVVADGDAVAVDGESVSSVQKDEVSSPRITSPRHIPSAPVMAADGVFICHCPDDTRITVVSMPKRQHSPLNNEFSFLKTIDEDLTMTDAAAGVIPIDSGDAIQVDADGRSRAGSQVLSQPASARGDSAAGAAPMSDAAGAVEVPTLNTSDASSIAPPGGVSARGSQPPSKAPSARPSPRLGLDLKKADAKKGKPDGFGTVMMSFVYPDDLQVLAHSDGTVIMSTANQVEAIATDSPKESIGIEIRRIFLAKGVIVRYMHVSSPFTMDILCPDGNRILRRNGRYFSALALEESVGSGSSSSKASLSSAEECLAMTGYYKAILNEAPRVWTSIILFKDGRLEYHYDPHEVGSDNKFSRDDLRNLPFNPREAGMVSAHSILPKDNRKIYIDAETKAVISTYRDGRRVIAHSNGSIETDFPDSTRYVSHKSGKILYITHSSLPTVEVDLEIDAVSRDHSNGIQVPISRGGDRVRCRVGLPDGSALLIKYDTRITAHCNGSMKLVRLDRSVFVVKDDADIVFKPGSSWDKLAEDNFAAECMDIDYDHKDPHSNNKKDVKFSKSTKEETLRMASMLENNSTGHDDDDTLITADTSGKRGSKGTLNEGSLESNSKSKNSEVKERRVAGSPTKPEKIRAKQKGVSELAQCNSVATIESFGVGSNNSASRIIHTNKDVFLNLSAMDTKYTYNPLKMHTVIEDYEHNKFEIDLLQPDPLKVAVSLAGEVEGLKPQALSEAPIDPRAFSIKRNGQVQEICSINAVSALESLVSQHYDGIKSLQSAISQPSDLGAAQQHLYYLRIRNGVFDKLDFDEIFSPRLWSKVKRPATVEYVCKINNTSGGDGNSSDAASGQSKIVSSKELCPRLYTFNMLFERLPLSSEGFKRLTEDVAKWEQFRIDRELSINRFAIEDTRSPEDIAEEQRVRNRLKQAYKIAKKLEKSKKDKEKEKAQAEEVPEDPIAASGVPLGGKVPKIAHTSLEKVVEEKNEENEFSFGNDDSEDEATIAKNKEVRDAFLTYSVPTDGGDFDEADIDNMVISRKDLPNAFLQLRHQVIKKSMLEDVLIDLDLNSCDSFYFLEFKGIYRRLENSLIEAESKAQRGFSLIEGSTLGDSDSDGYGSDTLYNPSISEAIPQGGPQSSTLRGPGFRSTSPPQLHTASNRIGLNTGKPVDSYWDTAMGQSFARSNPPPAEPLCNRPWDWTPSESKEFEGIAKEMPRGNAVNAVRTTRK